MSSLRVPGNSYVPTRAKGTCPALVGSVNFYDVLADGYHTPLTKTQIADLFQAGRLGRNQPCKQVETKEWRTIDEVFPLLKYDSSRQSFYQPTELPNSQIRNRALAIVISVLVISAVSLALYFALQGETQALRDAAIPTVTAKPSARAATNLPPVSNAIASATNPANLTQSENSSQQARLAQEHLNAARKQRDQAQADRFAQDRINAERRELDQRRAAGRTERIPLDQFTIVRNVGGLDVTVKIHDHDITTIDVWTGYGGPLQMTKQKGITGTGTDETLIYSNGRARLYYVWEISGKLNHCLLRVRDE